MTRAEVDDAVGPPFDFLGIPDDDDGYYAGYDYQLDWSGTRQRIYAYFKDGKVRAVDTSCGSWQARPSWANRILKPLGW